MNLGSIPGISANLPLGVIGNTSRSEREESWFETKRGIQFIAGSSNGRTESFEVSYIGSNPIPASSFKDRWCNGNIRAF